MKVLLGDRVAALNQLQFEYRTALWGGRFGGFCLLAAPLTNPGQREAGVDTPLRPLDPEQKDVPPV